MLKMNILVMFVFLLFAGSSLVSAKEPGPSAFSVYSVDDMRVIAQIQPQVPKFQYSDCARRFPGQAAFFGGESNDNQFCWMASSWSPCSNQCGEGTRTRTVRCVDIEGGDSESCSSLAPYVESSCRSRVGCGSWTTSAWSPCVGEVQGGDGVQVRSVGCASGNDSDCDEGTRPPNTRTCKVPYTLYSTCGDALTANGYSGIFSIGTESENSLTYCDSTTNVTWAETENYCFGADAVVESSFTCKVNGANQPDSMCLSYGVVKPQKMYNCRYKSVQTTRADFSLLSRSSGVSFHNTDTYYRLISNCAGGCLNSYVAQVGMNAESIAVIYQSAQRFTMKFYESYDYGGALAVYLNSVQVSGSGGANTKKARTHNLSFSNYGPVENLKFRVSDITNSNYVYTYYPLIESCELELIQ